MSGLVARAALLAAVLTTPVVHAQPGQSAALMRRPQEPRKPYPYAEEEVVYENRKASVRLAGTLTLPRGRGPFPAVLLVSGSGPQDRVRRPTATAPTWCWPITSRGGTSPCCGWTTAAWAARRGT